MLVQRFLLLIVPLLSLGICSATTIAKRSISEALFDELVFYTKYASAVENLVVPDCPKPVNGTLVGTVCNSIKLLRTTESPILLSQIVNNLTQTQGFVARDDMKKEIIVAFAGSEQIQDALTGV